MKKKPLTKRQAHKIFDDAEKALLGFSDRYLCEPPPPTVLLIVAGTYSQAIRRAGELDLGKRAWRYAAGVDTLRGWTPRGIDYCGTFYVRPDWDYLRIELLYMTHRMVAEGLMCCPRVAGEPHARKCRLAKVGE